MADKLEERLLRRTGGWKSNISYADDAGPLVNPDGPAALDEITRLNALVDEMREGLKPFAQFALEGKRGGEFVICKGLFTDMKKWDDSPPRSAHLHKDDFLRARALVAKAQPPVSHDQ